MNSDELSTALAEIVSGAHWVTIQGTCRERLVFTDERAWDWFHDVLDPWNDYSYIWLRNALDEIANYLVVHDHLQDFEVSQYIESSVNVYTGDLIDWLAERNGNISYLSEALQEGFHRDGFALLTRAQALAIEEVYSGVVDRVSEMLDEP